MPATKAPIAPTFRCDHHRGPDGVAVVTLAGEFDLAVAPDVDRVLSEAFAHAGSVEVDLQAVDFVDSAGVHVLLDADRRARSLGRRFTIVSCPAAAHRIFEVTGAAEVLPFVGARTG